MFCDIVNGGEYGGSNPLAPTVNETQQFNLCFISFLFILKNISYIIK
jgi:hypothetical protein